MAGGWPVRQRDEGTVEQLDSGTAGHTWCGSMLTLLCHRVAAVKALVFAVLPQRMRKQRPLLNPTASRSSSLSLLPLFLLPLA